MATGQLSEVLQHLRRTVLLQEGAGLSDGQLLEDYISRRDEAALAVLVRRHGAMVWGVCRRVLRNCHDAEDAFQATFLVFVRKAASIASRELLANWLYGVAHQTALKARATAARRRTRESQVTEMPEPAAAEQELGRDLRPLLDDELSRLPDRYRVVVVLCDLEGMTRKEAAQRLNCPEGTVAGRLARAREMLGKRLARHGLTGSGAALAALLSGEAAMAGVPPSVLSTAIKAANHVFAAGPAAATGLFSDRAVALAKGVLTNMMWVKLKFVTVVLVAFGVFGAALAACLGPVRAQSPVDPKTAMPPAASKPAEAKKPELVGLGTLLLVRPDSVTALSPDGMGSVGLKPSNNLPSFQAGRLSPDGPRLAFVQLNGSFSPRPPRPEGEPEESWPFQVVLRSFRVKTPVVTIEMPCVQLGICWSPDGKQLVAAKTLGPEDNPSFENVLIDAATGTTHALEMPAGSRVLDWSPNGKTFVVQDCDRKAKKTRLALVARDKEAVTPLCDLKLPRHSQPEARFSPDGKKVLFIDADPEDDAYKWGLSARPYVLDIATRKRQPLADFPLNAQALGVAWSPNGKEVAYIWRQNHVEELRAGERTGNLETEAFLIVADADGKNARTKFSDKVGNAYSPIFLSIDWR